MTGRALCLPSAGEIQQTPTREPTETLSKANSAEGAGLERAAGRAERGRSAGGTRAEGGRGRPQRVGGVSTVLSGLGWLPGGAGVRDVCIHVCSPPSGCQVRASHSFSHQVWEARDSTEPELQPFLLITIPVLRLMCL